MRSSPGTSGRTLWMMEVGQRAGSPCFFCRGLRERRPWCRFSAHFSQAVSGIRRGGIGLGVEVHQEDPLAMVAGEVVARLTARTSSADAALHVEEGNDLGLWP